MLKRSLLVLMCAVAGGCATTGGAGNYDQRAQLMVGSKKGPMNDAEIEGVWNDWSDSSIVIVHREGDEVRLLLAVGDTRPNIPLTTFEATNMGNPLPTPDARERAKTALKTWKDGGATPADRFLFSMTGKRTGDQVTGSWSDANAECGSPHWGNFYFQVNRDKNNAPVIYMSVYATAKKIGGGMGGQSYEFGRFIYFGKAVNATPPSLLEKLQKSDNFCRRTAE